MKVHVVTVGDELLIGQVLNTNASWLGEQLMIRGAEVTRMVTVPDELEAIVDELKMAGRDADLVVLTGGLGPTHDDLSRDAVAAFLGVSLELDVAALDALKARFSRHKWPMPARNEVQAMVPRGCEVLSNPVGTAPGLWYANDQFVLCVLPGVPHEMKTMMMDQVFPRIVGDGRLRSIAQRTLHTTGIGESALQELLGETEGWLEPGQKLAYLPEIGGVRLRITVYGATRTEAAEKLKLAEGPVRVKLGNHLFGVDGDVLEAKIGALLKSLNLTISTAESCTGGLIGDRITNISGASDYFKGGIVAYCNQVKNSMLKVSESMLLEHGAVSRQVAEKMAEEVRVVLDTDIGISATGIMGPTGGTVEKPVGTVWIGYADKNGSHAYCILSQKDRKINKRYASSAALSMLWRKLKAMESES